MNESVKMVISAVTRRVPTTPRRLFVTSYHCQWIHRPIDDPPKIVFCVVCDKKIIKKFTKKKHMKTHTSGDKTPICNICEKVLKNSFLKFHMCQYHISLIYMCVIRHKRF